MNRKKGFTLAELLIVIAIIGVLVAVAIPVFSRQLEKARTATCTANRRNLYATLSVEYMMGERDLEPLKKGEIICNSPLTDKICPDDKNNQNITVRWEPNKGGIVVYCKKHFPSGITLGDEAVRDEIIGYFPFGSSVDSGAGTAEFNDAGLDPGGEKFLKLNNMLQEKFGLTMSDIQIGGTEIASWSIRPEKGSNVIYFTTQDISELSVDSIVPVIKYNSSNGLYSVWEMKVSTGTTIKGGVESEPFLTLGSVSGNVLMNGTKSYEEAEQFFLDNYSEQYH